MTDTDLAATPVVPADLAAIPTDPNKLAEYWDEYSDWFDERCAILLPLWKLRIKKAQKNDKKHKRRRSIATIEKYIADRSTADLQKLDAELLAMQARTSIIVAAATLMFAVFVLRGSANNNTWVVVGTILLAVSLLMTAVSFFLAIGSLAPPFRKAWGPPYDNRVDWNLLVADDFETYVLNTWLANRRTPIITTYKRAHSVAIPLLMAAAPLTVPGLALVLLSSGNLFRTRSSLHKHVCGPGGESGRGNAIILSLLARQNLARLDDNIVRFSVRFNNHRHSALLHNLRRVVAG